MLPRITRVRNSHLTFDVSKLPSNAVTAHVIDTSNVISNRITNIGDDTSNYVLTTSNAVTAH